MKYKILCNIGDEITFNIAGKSQVVTYSDVENLENLDRIFRFQFSKEPKKEYFDFIVNVLRNYPEIDLRFYGNYSEKSIDWKSLHFIERLQIDLWETEDLKDISNLRNLKKLAISKNVKSTVSLKIIENLEKLECFFTSISKDIASIAMLENLKFLSLREIKTKDIDFLSNLKRLNEVWFSLGSYGNINGLSNLQNLEKLSIHQIRNFNNEELNLVLSKCKNLKALELQNLKNLETIDFLKELNELEYLFLEGNKYIKTYQSIEDSKNIKTFATSNSPTQDKKLEFLANIESVFLGDSYHKSIVEDFSKKFNGKNLWIYGKELEGKYENKNPFKI